jgi:hypothetical protein
MAISLNSPGVPLIGQPKLADAPLFPPDLLAGYLQRMEQALAQGAAFNSPVTVELLILGGALRDLHKLRTSLMQALQASPEEAAARWNAVYAQLPELAPAPGPNLATLTGTNGPTGGVV